MQTMKQLYVFISIFHLVTAAQNAKPISFIDWYNTYVRNCTPGSTFNSYKANTVCTCRLPGVIENCKYIGYLSNVISLKENSDVREGSTGFCPRPRGPYFDGCNWCQCNKNKFGLEVYCTKLRCLQKLRQDGSRNMIGGPQSLIDFDKPGPSKSCPSERFRDPVSTCNWCSCHNGWTICTRMACFKKKTLAKKKISCMDNPQGRFLHEDGCNWCYCLDSYSPICTRMQCIKKNTLDKPKKDECRDRTGRFLAEDGCNWCYCIGNGAMMCTIMLCPAPKMELPKTLSLPLCKDKKPFLHPDGCNWCHCELGTGIASCTLTRCPSLGTNKIENGLQTAPERPRLKKNKKLALKEMAQSCKTGDKFQEPFGCNVCDCIEDGVVVCGTNPCY